MKPPIHQAHRLGETAAPAAAATHVAITGGKGGVGKTIVAINFALLAQQNGYRTLLVDLDPGLGNVDVHLRLAPRFTIEDLALGRCDSEQALTPGPGGISVLAGQSGSTRIASGDEDFLRSTYEAVDRAAAGFDLVVYDTGAGIGPSVLQTVARCALAVSVTTPDPAAITDAYAVFKVLHGLAVPLPRLVINRAKSRDAAYTTGGRLASICERFLSVRPELAGWLRHDAGVERSVTDQRPAVVARHQPLPPVLDDFRALTAALLSELPPPASRRPSRRRAAHRLLSSRPA